MYSSKTPQYQGDSLCPGTSPQCPSLPCGQRCLYQYTGGDQDSITGTHTTPVARYTDDLSFKLLDTTGGCTVKAKSSSQLWQVFSLYIYTHNHQQGVVVGKY